MARTRRYSRTGGGGSQPWDRASKAGYPNSAVSENIWQTSGRSGHAYNSKFHWRSDWKLGQAAVISWMNSPGHRSNLLSPQWTHLGVGAARNNRGGIYLTQNFGGASAIDFSFGGALARAALWAAPIALIYFASNPQACP